MTTRRAVLFGIPVVALGALTLMGRVDDVARVLGARPVPEVRESDRALLARAITSIQDLLAQARGANDEPAAAVLLNQLTALGAVDDGTRSQPSPEWPQAIVIAASACAEDAVAASATQVAQVLASLAAGLSQLAAERSI